MHYAIDFGTSNTVVARINANGEPETINFLEFSRSLSPNPPLIPSLVYVQDASAEQVLIGQTVCDRGLDFNTKNARFFQNFKRAIGNPVSGFVPELDGKSVDSEQVGAWFLRQIINQLPDAESLVLTVPVDSFEPYRQWLSGICGELDIKQIQLLDEPTAAALGYGLSTDQTILVIDFGGGTLDLSLVKIKSQVNVKNQPRGFLLKWGTKPVNQTTKPAIAKVMAKVGQNLGGVDIDHWLVDYFHHTQGLPKNSLITRLAEKLKIALSTAPSATEVFFDDQTFESYTLELDRAGFQGILQAHRFFDQLDAALTQIQQQAQRQGIETIDAVLLVGGTAQIPAVQAWAAQHFPSEIIKSHKPFEAIAHGALSQRFELQDFLYHSYGIRYWDKRYRRHGWHPIVKAGQTYPSPSVELLLGASLPNQPSIELVIGELGESNLEVYFEGDRLVTRQLDQTQLAVQPLNDHGNAATIAHLSPLGQPGRDRLKVQFRVDEQRTLRITVEDLLTDQAIAEDVAVVKLI